MGSTATAGQHGSDMSKMMPTIKVQSLRMVANTCQ